MVTKYAKIIGGGITGIACAWVLKDYFDEIHIYEKTDRLGGLCKNLETSDYKVFKPGLFGEHIFHSDDEKVAELFKSLFNEVEYYEHRANVFVNGEFLEFPLNKKSLKLLEGDVYDLVFKPYSEKQWGTSDEDFFKDKISRVKPKENYDSRYFNSRFQYIPKNNAYDFILPKNCKVFYNTEKTIHDIDDSIWINTSNLDDFYGTDYLTYRSLIFEFGGKKNNYFDGKPITINYPSKEFAYTRVHNYEHYLSYEFPTEYIKNKNIPMYPNKNINIENTFGIKKIFNFYRDKNIFHLGRLGSYKYLDIDKCLEQVLILKEVINDNIR